MKSLLRWAGLSVFLLSACSSIFNTEDKTDSVRPDALAPKNLTAKAAENTVAVDLTWEGDQDAVGYRIYRAESKAALSPAAFSAKHAARPKGYTVLAEVPAEQKIATVKTLTYTDSAVTKGNVYSYRVRAVSESGRESDPSNLASSKPGPVGPAPTALAILAAKNEAASTQVHANDPREKITHTYTIKTVPAHGTAVVDTAGLVTFTPALDYEGKDSLAVTVTASDSRAGEVTIPIVVGNRAPSPAASPISIEMNSVGHSQVYAGDPDKADTQTMAITQEPSFGTATIDGSGLVTYVPPVNRQGQTRIVVTVTDNNGASGTATILVTVNAPVPKNGVEIPGLYCIDGNEHIILTSISIPINTILAPDTDYPFTAVVSYALPYAQNVGLLVGSDTFLETADGCGSFAISGTFNSGSDGNYLEIYTHTDSIDNFQGQYLVAANETDMPSLSVVSTTFPDYDGYLLDNIQYEWKATYAYNPNRSAGIWSTFFEIDEVFGHQDWEPYFSPINVGDHQRTFRLRAMPACGDDQIQFSAYLNNDISEYVYQNLTIPIAPPITSSYDYYDHFPLLNDDQTVQVRLRDCMGNNPTVQLRPSADFFTVDQDSVMLPATVNLTYHASKVPVGQLAEGVLEIISETGAFSTKTMTVSARRFDYDLSQWTPAYCSIECNSGYYDDAEHTVPLPFDFPYGNGTSDKVYASTNGALFFDSANGEATDYGNTDGSFNDLDPDYFGSPFVAFFWADNRTGWDWNYADYRTDYSPGVYYREVDGYVEILYWDLFSYSDYTNRNVILARIFPNGHIEVTYPMINPTGDETVAVYSGTGRAVQLWDVWSLQNGSSLNIAPLPQE